ncbi:MAG: hypothetical protein JNK15_23765 [Planctomycetes bacterium]|nr:hypothetical protein [Planctomycetota bacterium]
MGGFAKLKNFVEAISDEGKQRISGFRKVPTQSFISGLWADLSMSSGNPVPNYYASTPLTSAVLDGSKGLLHGGAVGGWKHLKELTAVYSSAAGTPMRLMLCDYLLYYPFCDQSAGVQDLIQDATLPRYQDGVGVQCIPVLVAAQSVGGTAIQIEYTNDRGESGRLSDTIILTLAAAPQGTIATSFTTSAAGPFMPLQKGDKGIRSIERVNFPISDTGLVALVLVKPLADLVLQNNTAPTEIDFLRDRPSLPRIYDGAYLNLLACPMGSMASQTLMGTLTTCWS